MYHNIFLFPKMTGEFLKEIFLNSSAYILFFPSLRVKERILHSALMKDFL